MTQSLSAADYSFIQLEREETPMHVGALLFFSGGDEAPADRYERVIAHPVTVAPFNLELVPSRLPGVPPTWRERDDVDAADHVVFHETPADHEALMATVCELHGRQMDLRKPVWECHIFDRMADGRFAIYYKIHHVCIDGAAAIQRMQAGLSADEDTQTPPLWDFVPPSAVRAPKSLVARLRGLKRSALAPAENARAIWQSTRHDRIGAPGPIAPFTAPNTVLNRVTTSGARQVAALSLSVEELRATGHGFGGATVNDVVLAVISGTLRHHLLEHDALPSESLVAMVPVSLRDSGASLDAGTLVSILLCDLATRLDDPLERLAWIVGSTRDGKERLSRLSKEAAQSYPVMTLLPAIIAMQAGLFARMPMPFNLVVSNVPGPREPLYDNGARLEQLYPLSSLWDRMGINFTMISYLDRLNFGIIATDAVADLDGLAARIEPEFVALRDAVGA